jgi:hypothetical protein
MVIRSGTDQNVRLGLDEVEQYFTIAGVYTIRLTIVDTQDQTITQDFTISMPES